MTMPLTRPLTRPLTCLVTGGTGGIGAAVAEALASRGCHVLVTGRDAARGGDAERRLRQAGAASATFLPTDHASLDATVHLVEQVRDQVDVLDVLVANAALRPLEATRTSEGL